MMPSGDWIVVVEAMCDATEDVAAATLEHFARQLADHFGAVSAWAGSEGAVGYTATFTLGAHIREPDVCTEAIRTFERAATDAHLPLPGQLCARYTTEREHDRWLAEAVTRLAGTSVAVSCAHGRGATHTHPRRARPCAPTAHCRSPRRHRH